MKAEQNKKLRDTAVTCSGIYTPAQKMESAVVYHNMKCATTKAMALGYGG